LAMDSQIMGLELNVTRAGSNMNRSEKDAATSLVGRVAVVTGGTRGIGRSVALALAGGGAKVAVISRTREPFSVTVNQIKERHRAEAMGIPADVTNRDEVDGALDMVVSRLGPVDILVNNAGTAEGIGPVWEVDWDVWWRDVEVSLLGTFL
jgi:NAD(P)-dependent dehydrogenase (short-subunit alcohol dehydrogenase family)